MDNRPTVRELLMNYIRDANIGTSPDIDFVVVQTLVNIMGDSGLEIYTEWNIEYQYGRADCCELIYKKTKKQKKSKDFMGYDFVLTLAKRFDEEDTLIEYYTEEDYYRDYKIDFEKTHFKCEDTFYKICEHSLSGFNKNSISTMYQHKYHYERNRFIDRWLNDPDMLCYDAIDFLPNGSKDGVFNMWELVKKDDYTMTDLTVSTKNIHELIKKLCENSDEGYSFMMNYLAHLIQYPEQKPQVGIFFSSAQGSGKDTFVKLLETILGKICVSFENDPENIFGKYNRSSRSNKLVIVLQEADNIKMYNSKIKDLITCETTTLGEKNVRNLVVKDYTRLIVLSNNENIIKIEADDRRWVMFKCYNFHIDPNQKFFDELREDVKNPDVVQKFKEELMSINIDKEYNFQLNRPMSEFYNIMKTANIPTIIRFLYQIIMPEGEDKYPTNNLCEYYNEWLKEQFETTSKVNNNSIGMSIRKYFYINNIWHGIEPYKSGSIRGYKINQEAIKTFITEKYHYIGDI